MSFVVDRYIKEIFSELNKNYKKNPQEVVTFCFLKHVIPANIYATCFSNVNNVKENMFKNKNNPNQPALPPKPKQTTPPTATKTKTNKNKQKA